MFILTKKVKNLSNIIFSQESKIFIFIDSEAVNEFRSIQNETNSDVDALIKNSKPD